MCSQILHNGEHLRMQQFYTLIFLSNNNKLWGHTVLRAFAHCGSLCLEKK